MDQTRGQLHGGTEGVRGHRREGVLRVLVQAQPRPDPDIPGGRETVTQVPKKELS